MSDIKFDISIDSEGFSIPHKDESTSFIDEEGLLPGTSEARETTGFLTGSYTQSQPSQIQFESIEKQQLLHEMSLKSKGMDLHYELMHNNQLLVATQGHTNNAVFTVHLDTDGSYTFTLHNTLDRPTPPNLVTHEEVVQQVPTQPGELYQLSFHFQPHTLIAPDSNDIQLYWGEELLYTLTASHHDAKNYTFLVEGAQGEEGTKLQFVSANNELISKDNIHDVSVVSTAQNKIPIDFGFIVTDEQGNENHSQFTVNVTTTPPIQVGNHEALDVIFEDGVYQTIVVNDGNPHHDPLTTLNLDNLFNHLAIAAENRVVQVVQREEHGLGTNVYEVKISDKSAPNAPITVADVQLSFPGGDGGLQVFQHNISIQESLGHLLPTIEHIT